MKKIKTGTSNSSEAGEDAVYDSPTSKPFEGLESNSIIEEERSPSIKSYTEDTHKTNGQRMFDEVLIPQRSVSTPSFFSSIFFNPPALAIPDSQKQVQQALETLQRKLLLEQQAAALRDVIKAQMAQGPLSIPPLLSSSDSMVSSKSQSNKNLKISEDGPEIIYGEVEFPLLSMAAPVANGNDDKKSSLLGRPSSSLKTSGKRQKKLAKISSNSSPVHESSLIDIRDSLTVTRAETQRSDSEFGSSLREMSEEFAQIAGGKKRKTKKAASVKSSEGVEKGKKTQKKEKEQEKTKGKSQKNDSLISPRNSGRRLAERKLNRWQVGQTEKKETPEPIVEEKDEKSVVPVGPNYQADVSTLSVKRQSSERRTPKMKWDPLSQDEGELHNFFEELRNLLNQNVDQEKAIQLLKENGNDVKTVLELVKANKDQYIEALTMQSRN